MIQKFVAEIEKAIDSSSIVLLSNIQKYFGPGEETVYLKGQITIVEIRPSNIPSVKNILNEISAMILRTQK